MEGQRVLGNILVRHGVVHPDALEGLYDQHREKGAPLVDLVVQNRVATEADVAKALALECGLPFVEKIDVGAVPLEVATRLPISYAKNKKLLLVADYEDRVELVCADPLNVAAIDDVRALVGKEVSVRVAAPEVLIDAIRAGMPPQREEQAGIPIHIMPNGDCASARGDALAALAALDRRA